MTLAYLLPLVDYCNTNRDSKVYLSVVTTILFIFLHAGLFCFNLLSHFLFTYAPNCSNQTVRNDSKYKNLHYQWIFHLFQDVSYSCTTLTCSVNIIVQPHLKVSQLQKQGDQQSEHANKIILHMYWMDLTGYLSSLESDSSQSNKW